MADKFVGLKNCGVEYDWMDNALTITTHTFSSCKTELIVFDLSKDDCIQLAKMFREIATEKEKDERNPTPRG